MSRLRPRSPLYSGLPPHGRGLRIGLLGGSFNPAHAAHRQISRIALKRLGLDAVWWLVTPGNPLKDNRGLPPLALRMAEAAAVADDPRIIVTGFEARWRLRFTIDVVRQLKQRCPGVRFVWLMGSDNLAGFARWRNWPAIAATIPIAVIDRPGTTLRAVSGQAAARLARARLPENEARALPNRQPPAWVFLHGRRSALSSTALRQAKAVAEARR
ncbi:nicotinate-nucleotide adenylyltransferase [Rhizobiales bacterium TNE-4]|nr:nicotinate-nucleotide adenylyltransferase [Rhizobiales bacterium TNE-4]MBV1828123.1 nicotinate-nucleotide adenylyltransferase [Rhizobiales bacterium TNE-4]